LSLAFSRICNFIKEERLEQGLVKEKQLLALLKKVLDKKLRRKDKFSALLIWHWLVFFPKLQLGRLCTSPQQHAKTTSSHPKQ